MQLRKELTERLLSLIEEPGIYKDLSTEELAEILVFLIEKPAGILDRTKVIQGTPGKDGRDGKDAISKEEIEQILKNLVAQIVIPTAKDGKDGKDAVVTSEMLEAVRSNVFNDLSAIIPEQIQINPESIRDSLELLQDDERLDVSAIKGIEELIKSIRSEPSRFVGGGATQQWVMDYVAANSGSADTFETVSKNLDASGATLNYTGDNLTSIEYASGIIKTLNYTGDNLTSVVLSGSTPSGISLTKTLSYTGDNLTGVTYS